MDENEEKFVEEKFVLDLPPQKFETPEEFEEQKYIKVYLASALTGRKEQEAFDNKIREAIIEVFSKVTVLKLPYLLQFKVYNPADHTSPGSTHSSEEIYHIDFQELVRSDFALFYVNAPSLGVGIERQIAAFASVPSSVVRQDIQEISRMFQGTFGGSLFNIKFASQEELKIKLSNEIAKYGPELLEKVRRRRKIILELQKKNQTPKLIFMRRVFLQMKLGDLAKETGVEPFWWAQLQRDKSGLIAAATFTPILSCQLREIINAGCGFSDSGFPHFNIENNLGTVKNKSLENLYEAYVSRNKVTSDVIVLLVWKEYNKKFKDKEQDLLEGSNTISKEEWLQRFREQEKTALIKMLGTDHNEMSDIKKESFNNLYLLSESESVAKRPLNPKTVSTLWNKFNKHIENQMRAARKHPRKLKPYTIQDWRKAFDELTFND